MIRGLALAIMAAQPAAADCRQALALGLDVSGSVDVAEYSQQIDGLAGALGSDDVRAALLSQPGFPVRIAVYEWSGPHAQAILLPWTEIADDAALSAAIARLARSRRRDADATTAIGAALLFGSDMLARQTDCQSLTLDLSGDGVSNTGPRPQDVPPDAMPPGTVVNGLVIGSIARFRDPGDNEIEQLSSYYRETVIRGPGAFVEAAIGFDDYRAAMERKLLRELTSLAIGRADAPPAAVVASLP